MNMDEMQEAPMVEKSKRDMVGERLKKKYPDKEYADDEALFGQINDDYEAYDNELGTLREREGKMTSMLANNPSSAQFLSDLAEGRDPWIAVIDRLGIDGVTDLINNPEKQAEYAEANKKFVERLAKEKALQEEYDKNLSESMSLLERMQNERGIDDDTMDAAIDLVMRMAHEAIMGKFTEETVSMALKAVTHEADLMNARTEGEVAGRNAKIDEKLRKPMGGDGQPVLGGSNNAPARRPSERSMFDLADEAR